MTAVVVVAAAAVAATDLALIDSNQHLAAERLAKPTRSPNF
jgi:hypothetical protein